MEKVNKFQNRKEWVKLANALVHVLRLNDGCMTRREAIEQVNKASGYTQQEMQTRTKDGIPSTSHAIDWARIILIKSDFLEKEKRGIWKLTKKGLISRPWHEELLIKFDKWITETKKEKKRQVRLSQIQQIRNNVSLMQEEKEKLEQEIEKSLKSLSKKEEELKFQKEIGIEIEETCDIKR